VTNPVRVLVLTQPSSVWGAQLRLMDLAGPLVERGVVLTLAGPAAGPVREHWEARGLPYVAMALPTHQGMRRTDGTRRAGIGQLVGEVGAVAVAAPRIARAARDYDALLSFSLSMHLEVALAGRLARRPAVIEVVDIVRPGLGRRLLRLASRLATTTVVNSHATAGNLDADAHRARVIHPGVDLQRFRPGTAAEDVRTSLGGGRGVPLVGIVGRVDPGKGVEVLIEAMVADSGPVRDAHLVVVGDVGVGDAGYLESLRRAARPLGDRVTFAGRRADVPAVMRCLDVLVNASAAEPFGRSVLEAQASGVAVIGTDAGGIPEFVADDRTGLLVPPGDPVALRAALARVLGDGELRRRLGAAGRAQAEERFDLVTRFDAAADTYLRLVPARSAG
jgi:glycosyltransferase involved in cell wall biosynthesis